MNPWAVVVAAALLAGYAVVSRRLSTTVVSGPMVCVAGGLAMGPLGLDLVDRGQDAEVTRAVLESALALVLFAGASAVRRRDLRRERSLPVRLLAIGLPLTMALGWLLAWAVLPGLGLWELAVIGVVLAPTDAALGQQAVSDERVPAPVRHGLSVESGLNDGIALPFFLLALAAAGEGHAEHQGPAAVFLLALVASGAIGLAAGWLGAELLGRSAARDASTPAWRQILVLLVPAAAYALCVAVDGSGFIGAWTAGLAFGTVGRAKAAAGRPATATAAAGTDAAADASVGHEVELTDRLGELLTALSFLLFGAVVLGPVLRHADWRMLLYALLSLTVVRMLPVVLALAGAGLRPPTVAYIGWFGPRGLASVVFGLIAFEEALPGTETLSGVIAVTVALSVLLHGCSAAYLGSRYGRWYGGSGRL
ncbi:sodium:proton antiporter [Streptomyces inusitatus]|uniref:Sodium:proton antiporter n=1 Tax=Streptomyces inusitatus TaxID=68221 RepID=A0A918Q6F7_9ACTN|nr:cation:proton antiporter [Streptomyces inusitatus]GGZ33634.1 sodium:proton antiporter [Streptomyces inusitatus]